MVVFDQSLAMALVGWNMWSLMSISHRSPWGLWTSKQRLWYLKRLEKYNVGLQPSVEGTIRIGYLLLLGTAMALYHVSFDCHEGYYAAITVIAFIAIGMHKISFDTLFWDYRDPLASFWITLLVQLPLWITHLVLVILNPTCRDEWTRWFMVSAIIVFILLSLYRLHVTWTWRLESKPTRKRQRRRSDIEASLLK